MGRAAGAGQSAAASPVEVPRGQPLPFVLPSEPGDTLATGQSLQRSRTTSLPPFPGAHHPLQACCLLGGDLGRGVGLSLAPPVARIDICWMNVEVRPAGRITNPHSRAPGSSFFSGLANLDGSGQTPGCVMFWVPLGEALCLSDPLFPHL